MMQAREPFNAREWDRIREELAEIIGPHWAIKRLTDYVYDGLEAERAKIRAEYQREDGNG